MLAVVYQSWVRRTGTVGPSIADAVRERLIEAVANAATEPGMHFRLAAFWRGERFTWRQRYVLISPLIDRRVLHLPEPPDGYERVLRALAYHVLLIPPSTVVLNSRDWWRMATPREEPPASVTVGAISGGNVQIGGARNTILDLDTSLDGAIALADALRTDAACEPDAAASAIATADLLDEYIRSHRDDLFWQAIGRASSLCELGTFLMDNTRRVLAALF